MTAIDHTPRSEIRLGLRVAALFFIGLLGGAAMVPLDSGVYAHGTVMVSGKRQAVQNRDGGVVTALHVREGARVVRGQVLLEISSADLHALERGMTSELLMLYAQRERLHAEREGRHVIVEPVEFRDLPAADRILADDALRGQRLLLTARLRTTQTEKAVWMQRAHANQEQIGGFTQQIDSNRRQYSLLTDELEGMRIIAQKGYASVNRIRALERDQAALDGERGALGAQILQTRDSIGEAQLSAAGVDRRQREEVEGSLRDLLVRMNELRPKLLAAREQLARSLVRAPVTGTIVGLSVFTVGGVVSPGQMLMEIVPQQRQLVVEVQVSPDDADDLHAGQTTQVRFSGFHDRTMPVLDARIESVSADSFTEERTGNRYYRAEASLLAHSDRLLTVLKGKGALKPGMPAEILIPLKRRSALDYLLGPVIDGIWKAGREA